MEKNISRRDFLKVTGAGAVAAATAVACSNDKTKTSPTIVGAKSGEGKMEMRKNEHNGDNVSLLGYGCMRWPMIKDENGKDIIDQAKVNEMVDYAMAHGVNYYDTSPAYLQGQSEKATGIALSRYDRKSFYIATKLSNFGDASEKGSIKMYHDSFDEMQTDYFDYYLLHSIGSGGLPAFSKRYVDNGMMDFVMGEREKGKIRQMGFSFHGNQNEFDQLIALHDKYHWDFVQIQMNYVDWRHASGNNTNAEYLYEKLDSLGIPITVMEPLQGGRLSRVPEIVAQQFKERNPDASVGSWAFRFVGSHPRILTTLSGMTYMEHLVDNVNTFTDFQYMNDEELVFIEKMAVLIKEFPTVDCNDCKYCMPCPYGINIPDIFRYYNTMVNEGAAPQSQDQENYRKLRRDYLTKYNKAIPTLRQADHCIGCRQCESHCPQSIRIPNELQRIDAYIEKLKQGTL
ncbi:MAG: aldo/keto reductase [Bacteroidales bacterium]|nr:aldo/keto reductase [Bacteroidales bacterium]